eukprot:m.82254 g.82254  ORF g.82254 m.82254 type:complete len:699 (+) comp12081_c0_seq3:493-2589(+)
MCGIFAYLNHDVERDRKYIINVLLKGLKRLEYRGYDSAGIAVDADVAFNKDCAEDGMKISVIKRRGKVAALEEAAMAQDLDYGRVFGDHCGIAHTRWATHGEPSEINSHPQLSDPQGEFVVIHNGIITNYKQLRKFLETRGYPFVSDTDTECVAKLVKFLFDQHMKSEEGEKPIFRELVEEVTRRLEGAFALIFKSAHYPNEMIATRRGSPLLVGIRTEEEVECVDSFPIILSEPKKQQKDNLDCDRFMRRTQSWEHLDTHEPVEYFLASDASAVVEHTNRVIFLEDNDVVAISGGHLSLHHLKNPNSSKVISPVRDVQELDMEVQQIQKGNFSHFMLKEIFEQPESVVNTMRGRVRFKEGIVKLGGLVDYVGDIKRCRRLLFVACGTSYHSAIATRQFIEEMTELPVIVDIASDFLDRKCPIFRDDVCFFISQSGETADTLSALRYCKSKGALTVGITNTVGSTISRETTCGVHINAGPEIGVASTKAYTSQVLTLIMFALMMGEDSKSKQARREEVLRDLEKLPSYLKDAIALDQEIKQLVQDMGYLTAKNMLLMGRGYTFANCLEGALKIKELTYMHAEGILAGELKHGPLALVDKDIPIIMLINNDELVAKSQNALEQVAARGGNPLVVAQEGFSPKAGSASKKLNYLHVPCLVDCLQAVVTVVPLQLISYHIATLKGHDVDCPRNLAKSVTVE